MNLFLEHFHYLRPFWLWMLLPLAGLLGLLWQRVCNKNVWAKVCDPELLPHLLTDLNIKRALWPWFLLGLAWFLSVIALAGPTWRQLPKPVYRDLAAKVILLDLSPTMNATDILPSRIKRARYKILDMLPRLANGQTGLVVFASEPYTVSPLTQDVATIAALVPTLTPAIMPVEGSQIGLALSKAAQLLHQGGANKGELLLLTASAPTQDDLHVAKQLYQQGWMTSVLGIGTLTGAPIPTANGYQQNAKGGIVMANLAVSGLSALAQAGGGRYASFVDDDSDINALLAEAKRQPLSLLDAQKTKLTTSLWQDEGRWFILPILPIALLAFRRGWLIDTL